MLTDFSRAEAKELPELRMLAADAVEAIIADGVTAAMNRFNGKAPSQQDSKPEKKKGNLA